MHDTCAAATLMFIAGMLFGWGVVYLLSFV
jgi:hypothetical protein